ncbi:hypothetical protein BZG36_00402 [Bifiguratus adelaidae]|uniref:Small ribosomal subunit protein uS9m n=1 Tax=Bifiguratus adelaidae TaxID=1938954 RepID=A0A261Y874_9FUNG|nr:hypothetical protein BZG36_00402 [Bifiguratus adelaidae]
MLRSLARWTPLRPVARLLGSTPSTSKVLHPFIQVTARSATSFSQTTPTYHSIDNPLAHKEKPGSVSYFTGNWQYNDLLIELDDMYKQYKLESQTRADDSAEAEQPTFSWKLRDKMAETLGFPLTTSQWRKIVNKLNQLVSLPHPPAALIEELERFSRFDASRAQASSAKKLDDWGRAYALGRRKESSARCWLVRGDGQILVNGESLSSVFKLANDREEILWPLELTDTLANYNAWCLVRGGGSTGQSQAIKLGIAKALLVHQPELKPILRKGGCITRDPRVVERKKPGQKKARAKYTWVKR